MAATSPVGWSCMAAIGRSKTASSWGGMAKTGAPTRRKAAPGCAPRKNRADLRPARNGRLARENTRARRFSYYSLRTCSEACLGCAANRRKFSLKTKRGHCGYEGKSGTINPEFSNSPDPFVGTEIFPLHEPVADQPTPDPSQEGNWPAGAAPLLGGVVARNHERRSARRRDSGQIAVGIVLNLDYRTDPRAPFRRASQRA